MVEDQEMVAYIITLLVFAIIIFIVDKDDNDKTKLV